MFLRISRLVFLCFLSLTAARPSLLHPRAGGPVGRPIPSNCSTPAVSSASGSDAFKPSESVATASQIYSYYLPKDSGADGDTGLTNCLQACYGYGTPGTCKSIAWAHNVTYTAYGATNTGTVCAFFRQPLTPDMFIDVTDGTYTGARVINIDCPSRSGYGGA